MVANALFVLLPLLPSDPSEALTNQVSPKGLPAIGKGTPMLEIPFGKFVKPPIINHLHKKESSVGVFTPPHQLKVTIPQNHTRLSGLSI
jgi:hypothetical protein